MKILAVVGSPRKKGNTSFLVQEAIRSFTKENIETEIVFLRDYDIKDCIGCEGCRDTLECVIKDDMQKLYPKILEADGIILASPTYYYNVTAHMKAFIDRCYCFNAFAEDDRSVWLSLNEVLGIKYAAVIAICEQFKEEDMGVTADVMKLSLEAFGYRVVDTVKVLGAFKAGEASRNEKAIKDSYKAGEKLFKTLQLRKQVEEMLKKH